MAAVLLLWTATPVSADESQDAADGFEQLALETVPEIIAETDATIAPSIDVEAGAVTVTPSAIPAEPEDGNLIAPPKLTVDFATSATEPAPDGVVELETTNSGSSAFMQPLENGYRIVTSTASDSGPDTFSYTLDVPADAYLEQVEDHFFVMSGDETFGVLGAAWAKDSNGADVPTWYSLEDRVLTQHLDLSGVDAYPILADPGWSYTMEFATNKSAYAIANLLGSCFNCYFPVQGAPRAFPTIGQLLPLRVAGLNFECTMATVSANAQYTWFQYSFYATHNHVDGPGSAISFTFHSSKLFVYAWVTNNYSLGAKTVMVAGARASWSTFAANLRNA